MTDGAGPGSGFDELAQCDLVMKGGVTSGVVYPDAVFELSTAYRFRRIGGSSAGAIAAALTAAAEFRRHEDPAHSSAGFGRLQSITRMLVDGDNLVDLFAPVPRTRRAFDLLMAVMDRQRSIVSRVWRSALIVVRAAPVVFSLVTLLALLPVLAIGAALGAPGRPAVLIASLIWVLPAVLIGLAAAALAAGRTTLRGLAENGFGIATGHIAQQPTGSRRSPGVPPLTDWLHESINSTAGLPPTGRPLTFGDLWGPGATARYLSWVTENPGEPQIRGVERETFDPVIDLLVTTTCLTQGLPYTFPFEDDTFHFCAACLTEYFPAAVVDHLVHHSRPPADQLRDYATDCPRHPGAAVRRLPLRHELPVVLAARLSLSFPLLISAVPLCYLDDGKKEGRRGLVTAWFSDGGITSNLPLHFFDTPLPRRPTFGINLLDADPRYPDVQEYMPPADEGPRAPREQRIDSVWTFAWALLQTMLTWQDTLQAAAPGFRDRVVEVYLPADEGGLNLTMSDEQIASLAQRGGRAGRAILTEFVFLTHRWLRFRVAMNGYAVALEKQRITHPPFAAQMPPRWVGPYDLPADAEVLVREQAAQLADLGERWREQGHPATIDPPCPEPEFKLVPRR